MKGRLAGTRMRMGEGTGGEGEKVGGVENVIVAGKGVVVFG